MNKISAHLSVYPLRQKEVSPGIGAALDALDEAQKDRRKMEGELQAINEKLSKYNTQLMQVKTNEAYRAMQKEIETTKAEVATHEERILEDMLALDDLEAEIKELEKKFQADKAEGVDRGWYAGGLGWANADGDGEVAAALRCALVQGERAILYAGNGIVADSDPHDEVEETRLKFRPFVDLLTAP